MQYGERELRILVVEDVEGMRSLLEAVLTGIKDVRPSVARNTVEARQAVLRHRPDLVLLDEVLPGESSLDFLQDLHKEGIPVLLLTGVEDPTHELPPQAMGRLLKPGWEAIEEDRIRFGSVISAVIKRGLRP